MLDLVAYVDESQTDGHTKTSHFAVAGTLATVEEWKAFEEEWRPLASALNEPYHAKKHKHLAVPLAEIMARHTTLSCYAAFSMVDYLRLVPHDLKSNFGAHYQLGLQMVLGTFSEWTKETNMGRVAYFVERGHPGFAHAATYLNAICSTDENQDTWNVETWGPASKRDLPVSCPDSVSYYGTMFEKAISKEKPETGVTEFLKILSRARKVKLGLVGPEALSQYVPQMEALLKDMRRRRDEARRLRRRARRDKLDTGDSVT